jgi:hypothetical protein
MFVFAGINFSTPDAICNSFFQSSWAEPKGFGGSNRCMRQYRILFLVNKYAACAIPARNLPRRKLLQAGGESLGILQRRGPGSLLDIRVTKNSLDRALTLANAIVNVLSSTKLKPLPALFFRIVRSSRTPQ